MKKKPLYRCMLMLVATSIILSGCAMSSGTSDEVRKENVSSDTQSSISSGSVSQNVSIADSSTNSETTITDDEQTKNNQVEEEELQKLWASITGEWSTPGMNSEYVFLFSNYETMGFMRMALWIDQTSFCIFGKIPSVERIADTQYRFQFVTTALPNDSQGVEGSLQSDGEYFLIVDTGTPGDSSIDIQLESGIGDNLETLQQFSGTYTYKEAYFGDEANFWSRM